MLSPMEHWERSETDLLMLVRQVHNTFNVTGSPMLPRTGSEVVDGTELGRAYLESVLRTGLRCGVGTGRQGEGAR